MGEAQSNPDQDLTRFLEQIDERLHQITGEDFVLDPDHLAEELQLDAAFLQQSVDLVLADIDSDAEHVVDVNDAVDQASREFLAAAEFPVVIKITGDESSPQVGHAPEVLAAVLRRAMQISAEHAGPGCMMNVETLCQGGRASVRIHAKGTPRPETRPVELRCASLSELLKEIGGEAKVEHTDEIVRLDLDLGIRLAVG